MNEPKSSQNKGGHHPPYERQLGFFYLRGLGSFFEKKRMKLIRNIQFDGNHPEKYQQARGQKKPFVADEIGYEC